LSRSGTRLIGKAFDRARDYDSQATAQAATARRLAELILQADLVSGGKTMGSGVMPGARIPEAGLPTGARVLDMGCGTGALAGHLLASGQVGRCLCADISPAMLHRASARLASISPRPLFAAMDASFPALAPGFHLVASNMALHWTPDMTSALAALWELVLPGGLLAVAVPGENTFRAWREAHERLGLPCGLRDFLSARTLAAMFPPLPAIPADPNAPLAPNPPAGPVIIEEFHALNLKRALDLPRHLKAVGGHLPRAGHRPLTPGQFRAVLAELDTSGQEMPSLGYHVLYALARKPSLDQALRSD